METLVRVVSEDPEQPRRLRGEIPRDLEAICLKCLEKKPSARYATASDLAQDLAKFLNEEPVAALQSRRRRQRLKPIAGAVSVMMAVLCVLGV
ncbi:MAG: protein kinase, partial [Candidatus Fonsibacter sp.]